MQLHTLSYAGGAWSGTFPAIDSPSTLVIAFGAPSFASDPAPLAELARAYPTSQVIGCSTSGEIHQAKLNDESIAVAVVQFDRARLRRAAARVDTPEASRTAGESIARELAAEDLRGVFLVSDGLQINGSELVRGLNAVLPRSVVVTGGLAGDGSRFERTWTLVGDGPQSGIVGAVGIYGDVRIGHGSRGGWDIFGPERTVTRSAGNVLYELDGKPALALYKEYLGERAGGLPATALLFPLALRGSATTTERVVRTVLAVDEDKQSMTFAGDIPQNGLVQLMKANFDRIIQGAADAGTAAGTTAPSGEVPVLAIAISCVGRRLVLGERTEEEIEAVLETLPAGSRQIGFYSYGEISPHGVGPCDLHNQTMTLTTIAEG